MKYIVTKDEKDKLEIFQFPDNVHHDCMAEAIYAIRNQKHGDWKRIYREPVSAGFVEGGKCVGESESLKLKSNPSDTKLLQQ